MRFLSSTIAAVLAGLVSTAVASSGAGNHQAGGILVQDRFLDDQNRAALLCRARQQPSHAQGGCRKQVAAPGWLSNRLLSVLGHDGAATNADANAEVQLPVYEHAGDHPEHQDRHVSGASQGTLAEGHVGVVYLEGDGEFVLTDTATGAEHREPIVPGKLISWPNAGFTHRVEKASRVVRRMLGPMTFDAAASALVGVGGGYNCTELAGYECVVPEGQIIETMNSLDNCIGRCTGFYSKPFANYEAQNQICSCFSTLCEGFVPAANYFYGNSISQDACGPLVLADPIVLTAGSFRNRATVYRTRTYTLLLKLTQPAASLLAGRRVLKDGAHTPKPNAGGLYSKKPLNTTVYGLLVTPPAGGAANLTYKSTNVRPGLKPASLKRPAVQGNGDLLWPTVPMHQYWAKNFTRTFKVSWKVSKTATSPLVFQAFVLKDGAVLKEAIGSPVMVTVLSK